MSFHHSKISSGISVVTFNMPHVHSISINIIVKVGSRYETEEESGISHFLEHMAFKGTKNRTAEQIAKEFDLMGGHFNAYTSREHTVYYTKVLSENFEKATAILSDILQNSLFEKEDIKKELSVIMQEMASVEDNPDDLVYEKFYSLAFDNQPIGRSILGNVNNLKKFNKESFVRFVSKHYTKENIVVAIAGNIEHSRAASLSEKYFHHFPESTSNNLVASKYIGGFGHIHKKLEQTSLVLGFNSVSYLDIPKFYSVQILSLILGGGLSSRLFQQIREKLGLAYSIGSFNSSYQDNGIFSIYAGTDHQNVEKVLDNLMIETQKIQQHISEEELQRAKIQIKTNILMAEESTGYKSEEIGKSFALFGKYFSAQEVLEIVANTRVEDLVTSAKEVFASKPTLSIVGEIPKKFNTDLLF